MVEMLKLADVARQLEISQTKARGLVKSGEIRSVRVGNRYRVRPSDLEEYLLRSEVRPVPKAPGPSPSEAPEAVEAAQAAAGPGHLTYYGRLEALSEDQRLEMLAGLVDGRITLKEVRSRLLSAS